MIWGEGAIARFLDVTTVQYGFNRLRHSMRCDILNSLDLWMRESRKLGIVNANASDLQRYLEHNMLDGSSKAYGEAVSILREFYSYLRAIGFRSDDPSQQLNAEAIRRATFNAVA